MDTERLKTVTYRSHPAASGGWQSMRNSLWLKVFLRMQDSLQELAQLMLYRLAGGKGRS